MTKCQVFLTVFLWCNLILIQPATAACSDIKANGLGGLKATMWSTLTIPVCWEQLDPNYQDARNWTRQAVEQTWENYSQVRFTGWGQCDHHSSGIRIGVADVNPHTKDFGQRLDGVRNGMVLDFTFLVWSPSCQHKLHACIHTIAIHEFGHALGFTHEQNRPDTPAFCKDKPQSSNPDTLLTAWDKDSVMNYCNHETWTTDNTLSALDIEGVQKWYGKPAAPGRFEGLWQGHLNYADANCVSDSMTLMIHGQDVQGLVVTPLGQRVEAKGTVDDANACLDIRFQFSYANSVKDTVTLRGELTGGVLTSSDCGAGYYQFKKP